MYERIRSLAVAFTSAGLLAFGVAACSDAEAALEPDLSLSAVAGADFSGSWRLNEEASDLAPLGMRDGDDRGRPPGDVLPGGNGGLGDHEGPGHPGGQPRPLRAMMCR